LRATTPDAFESLLKEYTYAQQELRDHIHSLMWHMRGSLSREEAWTLSPIERKGILHFINQRMKVVEQTGLPLI
jgi:hypothetical protein